MFDKRAEIYFSAAEIRKSARAKAQASRRFSRQPWVRLLLWGFGSNGVWSATLQGVLQDFLTRLTCQRDWTRQALEVAQRNVEVTARLCTVLCLAWLLSGCATSNRVSLPLEARSAVVCIYQRMSLNPAIHDIGVYVIDRKDAVIDRKDVVIVYGYWSKDRHDKIGELAILRIPATGKFGYRGDYSSDPDNPVGSMSRALNSACDVDGGYIDEVIITGPDNDPYRWLVDMSAYTNVRSRDVRK